MIRKLLYLLAVLVLLCSLGLNAYQHYIKDMKPKTTTEVKLQTRTIPVDSIVCNLGAGYLKVTMGLETKSNGLVNAITEPAQGKELMMQIRALLVERIGGLQTGDIDNQAKINVLKNNILKDVNEMLMPYKLGCIDKVIFAECVYYTH